MTTDALPRSRSSAGAEAHAAPGGFGPLVRSEWTKFRTVRGWLIGLIIAAILIVLFGIFAANGAQVGCGNSSGQQLSGAACVPYIPHGPAGEPVSDSFNFAHQQLTGNGSITVRVDALTGEHQAISASQPGPAVNGGSGPTLVSGLGPWSKAGIMIKQNLHQGSAYAAMLVTGGNGVRMQYNYTGDIAGLPGAVSASSPRWLRLTRSGDTITGYDSADGTHWTQVGSVQLAGLPATVPVGLFATSPNYTITQRSFGGSSNNSASSQATGVFADVRVSGGPAGRALADTAVGGGGPLGSGPSGGGPVAGGPPGTGASGFARAGGTYTLTGSGDIAPLTTSPGSGYPTATIEQTLAGSFIGLIAIVVVGAMFFTSEYRRGLIRTTLAASPRRGHVLAAKALVAGSVVFVVGLVASTIAVIVGSALMGKGGAVIIPVSALTEIRVVVGNSAMLGVAAAFAVALGAILRRSAAAIAIAVVLVVLPFLLAALNVLPVTVGDWLLRVMPTAGLAVQQAIPNYHQVQSVISPGMGYYPLSPLAGFAVLCAWAAAALALAVYLLNRRDA
jgi:ABC-type transport system involved in multi-copper enzyme maturation permease subunit